MSDMSARDEILQRIRRANVNAGVTHTAGPADPRAGRANLASEEPSTFPSGSSGEASHPGEDIIELFAERVEDYKAVVERCRVEDLAERIAAATRGAEGVIVPEGFPDEWTRLLPADTVRTDPGEPAALDAIEAVVTTSAAGIARTGTIVLDHSAGQGRRALTLVPDLHVCVVRECDVHTDVPQAVSTLRGAVESGRALTWISGPSATSDIELSRVEGVHGPRRLHVLITP